MKAQAALRVAQAVLTQPVADRTNWTLPRLADEIERREGVRISTSRLSVVLRKRGVFDSVARGRREMKRLAYLAVPGIGARPRHE